MTTKDKWRFAIGTTSRVPDSGGSLHYLIADFDGSINDQIFLYGNNFIVQRTPHGWHVYTDYVSTFDNIIHKLRDLKADEVWIEIAKQRGYFFLADKMKLTFPWPVEHMVLYYGKEET